MLSYLDEKRADNLRDFSRRLANIKNLGDYLSDYLSENRTITGVENWRRRIAGGLPHLVNP